MPENAKNAVDILNELDENEEAPEIKDNTVEDKSDPLDELFDSDGSDKKNDLKDGEEGKLEDDDSVISATLIERVARNVELALMPSLATGLFIVENTSGLNVNGKIFGGKTWLKDSKMTWNNKQISQNLLVQAIPSVSLTLTRKLCPDNKYLNMGAASLAAIIPILNNVSDGRGPLNYNGDKELDWGPLVASLIPLAVELVRPYLPKYDKDEMALKSIDVVDKIANGSRSGSYNRERSSYSAPNRI